MSYSLLGDTWGFQGDAEPQRLPEAETCHGYVGWLAPRAASEVAQGAGDESVDALLKQWRKPWALVGTGGHWR